MFDKTQCNILNLANISNNNWFIFFITYLSSMVTVFLGIIAVKLSSKANTINQKLLDISNKAMDIENRMLQLESNKKRPYLTSNSASPLVISFNPNKEIVLEDPEGNRFDAYVPLLSHDSFPKESLVFMVTRENVRPNRNILADISFSIKNETPNIITQTHLLNGRLRLYREDENLFDYHFIFTSSPICDQLIRKTKNIHLCIIDNKDLSSKLNRFINGANYISVVLEVSFEIHNIYQDAYKSNIGITSKSQLKIPEQTISETPHQIFSEIINHIP